MLTDRQRNVLDFIQSEQREKGITPSTREIQSHFGFASQTSVMQYIATLERKGFLSRHAGKARALITPVKRSGSPISRFTDRSPPVWPTLTEQTVWATFRSTRVRRMPRGIAGSLHLRVRGDSMIDAHILDGDVVILETARTRKMATSWRP